MRKEKYIPIITIFLLAVNVGVFLLSEFTGNWIQDMGGSYGPDIVQGHQYYRLITHFFIHFGFDHLFINMVSLMVLGYSLEGIYGRWRFLLLYFLSGFLAGVTSLVYTTLFLPPEEAPLSCGASGAIYGLMGGLLMLLVVENRRFGGAQLPRYLLFLALSLYSGIMDTSIDNAAHIGGFVAGCLIGFVIQKRRSGSYANGGNYAS